MKKANISFIEKLKKIILNPHMYSLREHYTAFFLLKFYNTPNIILNENHHHHDILTLNNDFILLLEECLEDKKMIDKMNANIWLRLDLILLYSIDLKNDYLKLFDEESKQIFLLENHLLDYRK